MLSIGQSKMLQKGNKYPIVNLERNGESAIAMTTEQNNHYYIHCKIKLHLLQ